MIVNDLIRQKQPLVQSTASHHHACCLPLCEPDKKNRGRFFFYKKYFDSKQKISKQTIH